MEGNKKMPYVDDIIEQTIKILSIDSPSGYTKKAAKYVADVYRKLGYEPIITVKGGVLVCIGGEEDENAVLVSAHMDTLGAIVSEIKENGRLRISPIGGMNPNNAETENCKIITRFKGNYDGTFQMENASIHVNKEYNTTKRSYSDMEVVIDEPVKKKEDVEKLGIMAGDYVCFDPRTVLTSSGFLKSRFLDDKLSVGILLGYAKYIKEQKITLKRKQYHYITVYEEVGHGASASIPSDVKEILSVDMGCVGEGLTCDEYKVSICAKDSNGPYHYDTVSKLIEVAKKNQIAYAVDVYPFYGSDADVALTAGYDIVHALIGAGVYASHGYERTHKEGILNTFLLLKAYLG